jgi:hypothetical protein
VAGGGGEVGVGQRGRGEPGHETGMAPHKLRLCMDWTTLCALADGVEPRCRARVHYPHPTVC